MAVIRLGNLLWKDNTQPNSVSNPVNTKDVNSDAIKNKVDTLATETKLEQVRTLLAGVATEDKLEQARALLQTISGKDFATQTTLAQVKSELELVKAELQEIKANQLSGDQKVQLSGTNIALPVDLQYHDLTDPLPVDLQYHNLTDPLPVKVQSGVVSFEIANQLEIRGTETHRFLIPSEVVEKCKDFDIYITDTHYADAPGKNSCDLAIALGVTENNPGLSCLDLHRHTYLWTTLIPALTNVRLFQTILQGQRDSQTGRYSRRNVPLSQVVLHGVHKFYIGGVLQQDVEMANRYEFWEYAKKAFLRGLLETNRLLVRFLEPPIGGSITIVFKGEMR